ncbi:MAG: hypothetical protein ABI778_10555, partial [Ignavibacteriota bacterium]
MKRLFLIATIVLFGFDGLEAQPIKAPYVFVQSGSDTAKSDILPEPPTTVSRVGSLGGHFVLPSEQGKRIRFFGTELEWTSQFLTGSDAKILAKRLHKLGFNAVRLIYNDYPYWAQASIFDNSTKPGSYNVNATQLARFDTLIYELKKQGIYSFLVLSSYHNFTAGDGVAEWDTTHAGAMFVHFIDRRASQLHREWAKTLLSHKSAVSGLRMGDDPAIAAIEVSSPPGFSLMTGWRVNYLNWIDARNVLTVGGASTIGWNRSRRLDTLFSQYLVKKYGGDAAINNAWKGGTITNAANTLSNGSFEQVGSTSWSFAIGNGALGDKSIFTPAIDSQYCMLVLLANLSPNPVWNDAYLQNTTARIGKDTL